MIYINSKKKSTMKLQTYDNLTYVGFRSKPVEKQRP